MISVQVDVDNLWVYEQEYRIKIFPDKEYIYTHCLPNFLRILEKTNSKATFMIIGRDLELPAARKFCRSAIRSGHEIGNHTWSHQTGFAKLSNSRKQKEILRAHELISRACGRSPVGFRGPGYFVDTQVREILRELNYEYDASVLPGAAQLLMSLYSKRSEGENIKKAFGNPHDIFSSRVPYTVDGLLELPISVLPLLRLPLHSTFAYAFGSSYQKLISNYFNTSPKYLLYLFHAIDFSDLGRENMQSPIVTFRHPFAERMKLAEATIEQLVRINHGPLKTTSMAITS